MDNNNFLKSLSKSLINDVRNMLEGKKIDQDKDGDNDFDDVQIARYMAGGMSKKDAIAKAKEVKEKGVDEGAEGLAEISKKLATSFLDKTEPKNDFISGGEGKQGHEKGRKLAFSKLARHSQAKVPANEEVELEEEDDGWYTHSQMHGSKKSETHPKGISAAEWKSGIRWHHGKNKRINVKEETEELDEITQRRKELLGRYIKGASHDVATRASATARYAEKEDQARKEGDWDAARKNSKIADKAFNKGWNRRQHIAKAVNKLTAESVEQVDENAKIVAHLIGRYGDNVKKSHVRSAAKDFGVDPSKLAKAVRKKLGKTTLEEEQINELTQKMIRAARDKARDHIEDSEDEIDFQKGMAKQLGHTPDWKTINREREQINRRNRLIVSATKKIHGLSKMPTTEAVGDINVKPKSSADAYAQHTGQMTKKTSTPKDPKTGKTLYQKMASEEVEELDEGLMHDRYIRSHGKKARGTGSWAFTTKPSGSPKENQMHFSSGQKSLSDAHKEAAAKLGTKHLYVMEEVELDEGEGIVTPKKGMSYATRSSEAYRKYAKENPHMLTKKTNEEDDVPFEGPYRKAGERKDEYGNKIKNVAKHLAKKAMKANEEVEQIDEISKDAALKYLSANKKDDTKARETGDYDRMTKRMRGTDMAVRKYTAKPGSKSVRVPATEEVEIDEKTLTPAEIEKREEVAKAIERENPNMPMGKKMAIATATAKKVAEEVEPDNMSEARQVHQVKYAMKNPALGGKISVANYDSEEEANKFLQSVKKSGGNGTIRKAFSGVKEEVELDEARGRPKANAGKDFVVNPITKEKLYHSNPEHAAKIEKLQKNGVIEKPKTEAAQHIINQLRKAATSMTGGTNIHFTHGDAHHVAGTHAAKLLDKYAGMKPDEKEAFQKKIGHSHANLKSEL
jgi:hypothetical protein